MSVLTNEGSRTAQVIARSLVMLRESGWTGELVSERSAFLAAAFLRESRTPRRRSLDRRVASLRLTLLEALTFPGLTRQYALRKRWLEEVVRRAVAEEGVTRVVVVGAGYDPLAARLAPELPAVQFVEVDHPATQAPKRRALEALGLQDRVELLPVDLERSPLSAALAPRADRGRRTLFVAEGLLMYFPVASVAGFLRDLPRCAPAGGLLAFSFMEPDERGGLAYRGSTPLARAWLRLWGEPLRWGVARGELGPFLDGLGLELLEVATSPDLRARYLPATSSAEVARGESLAVARLTRAEQVTALDGR